MSAQVIELLVFAAIAFFVISKLIAILGVTDEEGKSHGKSKFGEPIGLKDVTNAGTDWTDRVKLEKAPASVEINKKLLLDPMNQELIASVREIYERVEKFTIETFMKNASIAFKMILEALRSSDNETIEQLVDKRYINLLQDRADSYKKLNLKATPKLQISDVTFFGNSIMIRVCFTVADFGVEEWTFSRNQNQTGKNWYLSNIESAT